MLFVTGDTHSEWSRFNIENFPEQHDMKKSDYVLVLGDYGIWDDSKRVNWWMDWLNSKNFTTLFVSGNHDNYDILDNLVTEEWNCGLIQKIRPSVIHLKRGQVYLLDGKKVFTFGGAQSHDISDGILEPDDPNFKTEKKWLDKNDKRMYRINHKTWWERELPSKYEMDIGITNLDMNNWKVDYIFTHCAPTSIQAIMDDGNGLYKSDILTDYLENVTDRCDFKAHLFGHMHVNQKILDKHFCLFEQITRIW